jgi:hypothetical protein
VAGLTVRRVVGRCRFQSINCVEPGPTPAVAPKLVSWKSADAVFHHDEPASEGAGTAYGSGCHIFSGRFEHFLHENGAVGKVSVLTMRGDGCPGGNRSFWFSSIRCLDLKPREIGGSAMKRPPLLWECLATDSESPRAPKPAHA